MIAEATSLLAHDLNNQLALMLANFEFLDERLRERGPVDPEVSDTLSISQASLQHMMSLVRNMTDIARMEDPGIQAAPVATDITRMVRGVVREYRSLHDRGEVALQVDCPDVLRAEVDPLLFKRITHNLVANARRFVDKNGRIRVTVRMTDEGGPFLTLTVANSGTRIEEERRPTLFEKYRLTADGRVTRGMGLYFCRLACDSHGGSLAVVDDPEFATMLVARVACGPRPAAAG